MQVVKCGQPTPIETVGPLNREVWLTLESFRSSFSCVHAANQAFYHCKCQVKWETRSSRCLGKWLPIKMHLNAEKASLTAPGALPKTAMRQIPPNKLHWFMSDWKTVTSHSFTEQTCIKWTYVFIVGETCPLLVRWAPKCICMHLSKKQSSKWKQNSTQEDTGSWASPWLKPKEA